MNEQVTDVVKLVKYLPKISRTRVVYFLFFFVLIPLFMFNSQFSLKCKGFLTPSLIPRHPPSLPPTAPERYLDL